MGTLRQVWAVVPVHNEVARVGRCLTALDRAVATARTAGLRAGLVVVLDSCSDGSEVHCSQRPGLVVVRGRWRRVGSARAAGCATALRRARRGGVPAEAVWLANTDADSTVPFDWLTHHVHLADRGADAVRGTVVVDDWSRWPGRVQAAHRGGYRSDDRHLHVHGANLGVRGSAYLEAGGFAGLACHEDVALVDALAAAGQRVTATGHAAVRTSGRRLGRAPDGFAGHLRSLAERRVDGEPVAPADGA
ncbi:MAG: glycosyltransferase [Kineosporiaceae bacterium]